MVSKMINYNEIGKRIAYFRRKNNLTQQKLADKMDLSVSFIGQIERGITQVSLERLYEISEILNVDIVMLLSPDLANNKELIGIQISEIIKDWSVEQINFLVTMLYNADEYLKNIDK